MACHRYRLNSDGFLVSRDMVRTFNIRKLFTQNNHFNNLHCIDQVVVSYLVYRFLSENVSSDFFKKAYCIKQV